jgi:hypothetical protein
MLRNAMLNLPPDCGGSLGTEALQKQAASPLPPDRAPAVPGKQRKSRFWPDPGRISVLKRALFQALAGQIRYSADQWNFSADQRIKGALTIE